ncbi:prolipoprotein diacylglyceryl transferase [Luteolibacter sp. SL250]|uniref:prolipoprotein diacylglyceryl transferase n=1 Tax=Luteolibacter sp. SL250 TaxID=2995170 RepID=UPI00226E7052|nr:prolipoprotein diacylglyceryl transferase [Luteolibacter sp. SL250]WAC18453.1 prolipoprotein diacylglyceryl transferase [Luteolibacter sp. SL250]
MSGVYVHDLDPVALPLFGNLALRWYGLAYLMGFVMGFLLLRHLARKGLWVLKPEKTGDFIAAAALFGVFLGGRLGYILFYHIPKLGWGSLAADPLLVFKVWEGGMASHGGILGLVIFTWFYARKHKVSWTGLGDGLCVVAPLGLFFGRAANFINGELYGRISSGLSWAVKFPTALMDAKAPESGSFEVAAAAAVNADPALAPAYHAMNESASGAAQHAFFEQLLAATRKSDQVKEAIASYLEPRHPSQVYEGALEGLLLFAILWIVRVRFPKAPHGLLTGLFFGLYAIFRIFAERFREPDAAWVIEGVLTQGQFLSLFMFAFSAAFLILAWKRRSVAAE